MQLIAQPHMSFTQTKAHSREGKPKLAGLHSQARAEPEWLFHLSALLSFQTAQRPSIVACIGELTKQGQILKTCKEDSKYYCYDAEGIMLQKSVCWIVQFNQFKVFFLLTFFLLCHSRLTGINWFMNKWAGFLCLVNIVLLCKFWAHLSSSLQLYARGHILKIHMERDNAHATQIC